jgi:hypothetical protein
MKGKGPILAVLCVAVVAVAAGLAAWAPWKKVRMPGPKAVCVTEVKSQVVPVYVENPDTGEKYRLERDLVPMMHIERYYKVENLTGKPLAIGFRCSVENVKDWIREPYSNKTYRMLVLGPKQTETIRIWFAHYTNLTEVYYLKCRWKQLSAKHAIVNL